MSSGSNQPSWVIATVLTDPVNTWTEGLTIVDLVCVGNTTFWETKDPTEVEFWKCESSRMVKTTRANPSLVVDLLALTMAGGRFALECIDRSSQAFIFMI